MPDKSYTEPPVSDQTHWIDTGMTHIRAIRDANRTERRARMLAGELRLVLSPEHQEAVGRYVHERMAVFAAMQDRWDFSQKAAYAADTGKGVLAIARGARS